MRTIIPFGPQHPVLPEPLHLKLTVDEEIVTEAMPAFGYVHRGLEKLADIRDYHQMVQIVERVCGICSMIHAMCYCQGIEDIMALEVPPRAKFLRVIWSELHRIHSHLLWLGLFADAFGFESLFMQCWRIREKIMDINEATAGNRIIVSVNVHGGVRRDLSPSRTGWILTQLIGVENDVRRIEPVFFDDVTIQKRTRGKGVLSPEQALELGAVGPVLRASRVAQDSRQLKYAAFDALDFEPVVETDCDCYARSRVRLREIYQSIDLIRQAIARMPEGEIAVKCKGNPDGETTVRVEQPRGEVLYYIKAANKKNLDRLRIRTPTFANIPPLTAMLPGIELADVPVVILSIDPCISCTER
jgi:ech hydrogenase subunit E